jgi:hypothetical protein
MVILVIHGWRWNGVHQLENREWAGTHSGEILVVLTPKEFHLWMLVVVVVAAIRYGQVVQTSTDGLTLMEIRVISTQIEIGALYMVVLARSGMQIGAIFPCLRRTMYKHLTRAVRVGVAFGLTPTQSTRNVSTNLNGLISLERDA